MSIKLTTESFLTCLRSSGLLDERKIDQFLESLPQDTDAFSDAATLADLFVKSDLLTSWQSEKLLQGRHKGFLLGRYRLRSLLSRGEMSAVYLAQHVVMERQCAIKVLPANRVKDTSYLGRFYREARAVASLDNPHIVRAYDVDHQEEGGAEIHFLVLEFVPGDNLESLVRKSEPLEIETIVDLFRQAAVGLAAAHKAGLVHRDIKPGNLLIGKDKTLKLLDLGLARFFKSEGEESLTIKHDEKVLGTADYLAPEQAVDSHEVDERADIYSLGCTMYFTLTGHPPFTEGTLVQRLMAHQTKTPPPVTDDRPETPESLLEILGKMMHKEKDQRYQTGDEMADALSLWLVENGSDEWKHSHAEIVIRLKGPAGFGITNVVRKESAIVAKPSRSQSESSTTAPKKSRKKGPVSQGILLADANEDDSRVHNVASSLPQQSSLSTSASVILSKVQLPQVSLNKDWVWKALVAMAASVFIGFAITFAVFYYQQDPPKVVQPAPIDPRAVILSNDAAEANEQANKDDEQPSGIVIPE